MALAPTSLFQFTMLSISLTSFFILAFLILVVTLNKNKNTTNTNNEEKPIEEIQSLETGQVQNPENTDHDPAKWDMIISENEGLDDERNGSGQEEKRDVNKRVDPNGDDGFVCLPPFTNPCSSTQRKMKEQYDSMVKAHTTKGLTLDQVGQFVSCVMEASNDLDRRSEVLKRRIPIASALLSNAEKSSYDRRRQQVDKLEFENNRLQEDIDVFNWLRERFKVSPAYKKMIEVLEILDNDCSSSVESTEAEFSHASFEEFLALEKKDAFWQRKR